MFTAAIKTDESHHVLQKDQGNHIHKWNTLIFSPFQQDTQESKLSDTVVVPGAQRWNLLEPGDVPRDCSNDRDWLLVIFEQELPEETDSTNVSLIGTYIQRLFLCS